MSQKTEDFEKGTKITVPKIKGKNSEDTSQVRDLKITRIWKCYFVIILRNRIFGVLFFSFGDVETPEWGVIWEAWNSV